MALILILLLAAGTIALIAIRQEGGTTTGPCRQGYPNGGAGGCLFQFQATVTVALNQSGTVSVTVQNLAYAPFVSIGITGASPSLHGLVSSAPFTYNGTAISSSNPLPVGSSSSGSFTFTSGGSIGANYTIIVTSTATNGNAIPVQASFVAQ